MSSDKRTSRSRPAAPAHQAASWALRRYCAGGLLLWTAALLSPALAQVLEPRAVINREYAIKAAFLYHFSTYVEWPTDVFPASGEPFVIGVVHANPFGTSLDQIAKTKTVEGRPINIRPLSANENLRQCHILFVPRTVSPSDRDAVLRATRGSHVFVVGETDDFVERGGDAQFFLEGNKVRFAFSATLTTREDLKVSSKLLSLAKIVPGR